MKRHIGHSGHRANHFKKPKRIIGGPRRQRPTRGKARSQTAPVPPLFALDQNHTAEPNDRSYKGLLGCMSNEAIDALVSKWFKKFNRKTRRALRKRVSADNRAIVEALLLQAGATSIPLLTSERICVESSHLLRDALVGIADTNPDYEFGMVTFISGDGGTSHFRTEIDLYSSRKRVDATLRAMAPHYFCIIELALFNSQGHPSGGQMLQRHEHAVIWGPPGTLARAQAVEVKHAPKYAPNFSGAPVIDIRRVASDPVNLARVAAYFFKPPYKCMNWNPGKNGKPGFMNGSEKGDRSVRYLRLAQIRTMLPFEDTFFGSGDGQRIKSEMIKFIRPLAVRDASNGRAVLHSDAIASFWVGLVPQIKADRWNLPIVKVRNS